MIFPLLAALVFTLATLLVCGLVSLVLLRFRVRQRSYWRPVFWVHLGLLPLHSFVTFPVVLGGFASRQMVHTRKDERTYTGPRLDAHGRLLVQNRKTLEAELVAGAPLVAAEIVAAASGRQRTIPGLDGVTLRAFRIEAKQEPPRAVAVLVHGLFRSALELEPVAAMLREQGCECWLVELRNFGGSSRAPFSLGARESDDVVAAVEFVRAQPGRATTPLLLFGVSFGTAAISLALPRLENVAAVALDAPIDDMLPAAHRLIELIGKVTPFGIEEPWQSLVLRSLEWWSDVELADLSPIELLSTLPHDLPVLVVGAGKDERAPPETVERLFARLPMPAERKRLWMVPASEHGHVFLDQPEAYAEQLRWLLEQLRR